MTPESAPRLRRRGVLVLSAVAGAVAVAPLRPWRALVEVRTPPLAARLARLLHDQDGAATVGAAYLVTTPVERSGPVLVGHLRDALAPAGAIPGRDRDLRVLLDAAVRRDFEVGAVCSVDGWVLSVTEARLSALTAVTRGR